MRLSTRELFGNESSSYGVKVRSTGFEGFCSFGKWNSGLPFHAGVTFCENGKGQLRLRLSLKTVIFRMFANIDF